jgi:ATP-dependent Lon protease
VLPRENEAELDELPAEVRDGLQFVLVDSVGEVLDAALDGAGAAARPAALREHAAARPQA